ncbi:hypothetical protein [Roseateles chitosanitabidus]|nr:hypothetical protein [Roseateles chitosanitabidus]
MIDTRGGMHRPAAPDEGHAPTSGRTRRRSGHKPRRAEDLTA